MIGLAEIFTLGSNPRLKGSGEFFTYLHQNYLGQGLGTFMTRTILDEAKRRGFHRIELKVVADNSRAIRAYEHAGFVQEGMLKDAYFGVDGAYHDQLVMGIVLT
jgi:RimJ/RimL family protein N-acetyltransferase